MSVGPQQTSKVHSLNGRWPRCIMHHHADWFVIKMRIFSSHQEILFWSELVKTSNKLCIVYARQHNHTADQSIEQRHLSILNDCMALSRIHHASYTTCGLVCVTAMVTASTEAFRVSFSDSGDQQENAAAVSRNSELARTAPMPITHCSDCSTAVLSNALATCAFQLKQRSVQRNSQSSILTANSGITGRQLGTRTGLQADPTPARCWVSRLAKIG